MINIPSYGWKCSLSTHGPFHELNGIPSPSSPVERRVINIPSYAWKFSFSTHGPFHEMPFHPRRVINIPSYVRKYSHSTHGPPPPSGQWYSLPLSPVEWRVSYIPSYAKECSLSPHGPSHQFNGIPSPSHLLRGG